MPAAGSTQARMDLGMTALVQAGAVQHLVSALRDVLFPLLLSGALLSREAASPHLLYSPGWFRHHGCPGRRALWHAHQAP
jgi:hypothetical protein